MYRCGSLFDPQIRTASYVIILMFKRMATETRKRAHFKFVIKSKLFSTGGSRTHSASICLMTHFRCRQLCHIPSICVTQEEIIVVNVSPTLLQKFLHILPPMVFKIPVRKVCKKSSILYSLPK